MSDKPKKDPLTTGWVLAKNITTMDYFAFRTDEDMDSNSILHHVRTFTRFYMHHETVKGDPMVFMLPKVPVVKGFDGLLNHDTLVTIDLTGFIWWPLEERGTIDEILKAWMPERMTPAEKEALDQQNKKARKAREPKSNIVVAGNGAVQEMILRQKVAKNLAKLKQRGG